MTADSGPGALDRRQWLAGAVGGEISDAALRQVLLGLAGVDQVATAERTASLATRSIKREAKLWALTTAIRMVDLTTLEGADTPGKVRSLAAKARRPDPDHPDTPQVAAGDTLPVEVLMKSAPASMASQEARLTLSSVASSPVSRMTLRCARPQASRTARTSS